jgi:N-acetylneuraminate synthase
MAKACGCNSVKFQKRDIDVVYTKEFLDSLRDSPWGSTQREQKEGIEFNEKDYQAIDDYCWNNEIEWFASAWDVNSQTFLKKYGTNYNKIASAMLTHKVLVEMVASEEKHTFISTGMSDFDQIDRVVEVFERKKCPYALLHCVSLYPCPDEWCNVAMVKTLKERYACPVGYSGHEMGILPSVLAVAMGAEVIERHITLDRGSYGSDQSASLEKEGLMRLVRDCRDVAKMVGTGEKVIIPEEAKVAHKLRYFHE